MPDPEARLTTALSDRYEIEGELGHGGMAVVYLANDVKHDRKVALKVLRQELAAVIGAERFLQEIKVTANLQHPHILPLHDSGEADSFLFYVMPYVQGESLRDLLDREKQLGIEEAVTFTTQIASALDYAHRHDVIHRDIKPDNILIHDGQALVADFGIALAVSHAGATRMTETGLSIGTPQYMSPEQAMGDREVDARSDVYSLGAVLYEMLTGDPPYTGSTAQAIVAKVITEKPTSVSVTRDTVPDHVAAAVDMALAKLPADRFHSAADFSQSLAGRGPTMVPGTSTSRGESTQTRASSNLVPWAIAAVMALVSVVLVITTLRGTGRDSQSTVHASLQLTPPVYLAPRQPAFSVDGQLLVISGVANGENQILARRLDSDAFHPVPGTEQGTNPFLSPDGNWIGFTSRDNKLMKVRVTGGSPVELTDAQFGGGDWGADGTIVYTMSYLSGLWRTTETGADAIEITTPDLGRRELAHWWPQILPDGEHVLFTNFSTPIDSARLEVVSLKTGQRTILVEGAVYGRYVTSGHLLYARDESIRAVRFDPDRLEISGSAVPVVEDVAMDPSDGLGFFAVSHSGHLAYVKASVAQPDREMVWIDRRGLETAAPLQARRYLDVKLSPDGGRVALSLWDGIDQDVWIHDFDRELLTRLTFEPARGFDPLWTPDGQRVIYRAERPVFDLYWLDVDGSQGAEPLLVSDTDKHPGSVSPDGTILAYGKSLPAGIQIWLLPLIGDAREPVLYLATEYDLSGPRFSPNGKWMTYTSDESGRNEVYLQSYPDPSIMKRQVSTTGGRTFTWTKAGREFLYVRGDSVLAVSVDQETGRTGRPVLLFRGEYGDGDVTADGERFLIVKMPDAQRPRRIELVLNWLDELETEVP
jgi:serine/threonine protein kinase